MISFREIAQRMDPVRPPDRLRGVDKNPRQGYDQWYWENFISELPYADQVGRWHQIDKGLGQMHRTMEGKQLLSLRQIGQRHTNPNRVFSFLWYNTWLIDPPLGDWDPPELHNRAVAIGNRIGQGPWDVVALCEVFDEEKRTWISSAVGQHRSYKSAWGGQDAFTLANSGLLNFALNGCTFDKGSFHSFEAEATGLFDIEGFASKGVLFSPLRLRREGSDEEFVINLFTTHLHAESAEVRKDQIKELVNFVNAVRIPTSPTLIAGDFNVRDAGGKRLPYVPVGAGPGEWSVKAEFDELLQAMIDFEDLGLTRGGLSASTHSEDDYTLACQFDSSAPWQKRFCENYPSGSLTSDEIPGNRIDYVFLERPKKEHAFVIDIPRIGRRPMFREFIELNAAYLGQGISPTPILQLNPKRFWTKIPEQQREVIEKAVADLPLVNNFMLESALKGKYCGFLSDHLAVEVDLIITPISELS